LRFCDLKSQESFKERLLSDFLQARQVLPRARAVCSAPAALIGRRLASARFTDIKGAPAAAQASVSWQRQEKKDPPGSFHYQSNVTLVVVF
jgi:hypothetical protein